MYIFLIGFLTLFLELTLVRWLPANMFVLTYFANTVLISAFLGLGLGHLATFKKSDYFQYFLGCLLLVVVASYAMRSIYVHMIIPDNDLIWNFVYINNWLRELPVRMHLLPALGMAYAVIVIPFIFLGHKTSLLMQGVDTLRAYTWHVLGSVAGILAFGLVNILARGWEMPFVWFAVVCVIWSAFYVVQRNFRVLALGSVCALSLGAFLFLVIGPSHNNNWSPYYDISVTKEPSDNTYHVFVNRFLHQIILDFTHNDYARAHFDLPYQLAPPKHVLVLGAGNGNDVATALRNGALSVTAVEVDPVIASVGIQEHPNQPYQDQRVELTIADARNFLSTNTQKYDFIIIGTLDSHALLSGMSTVRIENYLYTRESFALIRQHLTPDGILIVQFSAPQQWLADKIFKTASDVFVEPAPLLFHAEDDFLYNILVMAGPGVQKVLDTHGLPIGFVQADSQDYSKISATTDNWPYLYLRRHSMPAHYLLAILLLICLAASGIYLTSPVSLKTWLHFENLTFFSLGAAFLLLETLSVTRLSLIFGTTWVVSAVVFAGVLLMILAANLLAMRWPWGRGIVWVYAALALSLCINLLVPMSAYLALDLGWRYVLSVLVASLPLFFGSMIFSFHIRDRKDLGTILGINLLGAMVGGFLEYLSMLTGLKFLYVVAMILYLVAYLAYSRPKFTWIKKIYAYTNALGRDSSS